MVLYPKIAGRVDEGAMWIHDGLPGNPLYHLATSLNAPLSLEQDYLSATIYTVDGQESDLTSRASVYFGYLTDVLDRIEMLRSDPATNSSDMDIPLSQIYSDFLVSQNISPELQPTTNLMAHTGFQVLLNANLTELSTLRYGDAKTLPAVDVLLENGFDSLVEILKQGVDIRYNTPVASVVQGSEGVEVTSTDGMVYTGNYVVTTQSLGCLKNGGVVFEPPLPENKLKAINDMVRLMIVSTVN